MDTFRTLLANKAVGSIALQIKELITNEMLVTMFPLLHKLASICFTVPVSTAPVERSFSRMKRFRTHLRNSLSESRLSYLWRITVESTKKLQKLK